MSNKVDFPDTDYAFESTMAYGALGGSAITFMLSHAIGPHPAGVTMLFFTALGLGFEWKGKQ